MSQVNDMNAGRLSNLITEMAALQGRGIYEDRGARISIMARANAHGPDTLQQTARDQLASTPCRPGRSISERARRAIERCPGSR